MAGPNTPGPRKTITKSISLPEDVWESIIDCQHANRLVSQAETIRRAIVAGLPLVSKDERGGKEGPDSC